MLLVSDVIAPRRWGRKFYPPPMLAGTCASSLVIFTTRGDYRFTTKPSAGYMPNLMTVLRQAVHVT